MKKSTLSTAILVGIIVGLAGCRGEDSNIVFADQKSNDRFTEANPHRKHQPNKYIVEDVNRKPGTLHNEETKEIKKEEKKPDPKKFLDFSDDEYYDERGYPRIRTNNATINTGNKPGEPDLTGGSGTTTTSSGAAAPKVETTTKVETTPKEEIKPNLKQAAKFQAVTGASVIQGTTMKAPTTSTTTGAVNKGLAVRPLSAVDREKVDRAIEYTNRLRKEQGLPPLRVNESLNAYATVRAQEITKAWGHDRPDGSSFTTGIDYTGAAGENIAAGHKDADTTVLKQWKDSPGHLQNMLDPNFEEIGIGYVHDPSSQYGYYWVQIFGSSNTKSKYKFDDSLNSGTAAQPTSKAPSLSKLLDQVSFDKDGKVSLGTAKAGTNQASSAYQAGNLKHDIYKKVRVYEADGYKGLIQDPAGVFSYQTFGEVVDPNNMSVQFINIGQPTAPSDDTTFEAHYSGASLGAIDGKEHVYADVAADVNFGKSKTMDLKFTNSKRGDKLTAATELDFSEKLNWQSGKFQGSTSQAHFYGPNGEEIGGHFSRSAGGGSYEGVFGLKKQ